MDKNEYADIFAINKTLHYYEKKDFSITYDALGREISRTDARGVVFVTKYDYLGRVTQRKADDATINYTYGSSETGQMRLISERNGTWTKNYTYDNLGRVTEETMSKGTAFTRSRSYTYGSNGLIASRTLPGGMVYSYSYDAYGNLDGIDMGPGIVGWSSAGYTGRRTTAETVLNGDTEHPFFRTIALDGYGLPDSIITLQRWGQSYCHYQSEDYGFSPQTGNLMYRSGIVGVGYPQQYTYDTADRLTLVQEDNQTIMTMAYAQNGNILSKTGMGSYTYGSSSRPHAVTEVDNTDGSITLQVQDIGFNYWNKMSSVWATDENNFYSYSVDYGPDLRRVSSEMHRTYQKLYEKFYWDDYEEKVEGSDTLRYYYLNGANGLEALHIVKTSPNAQPVSQTTKVVTDHLGSITALIDESDYAYIARYDAWGNREIVMPYWFDLTFDRGYTGHEHLEMLGLINMNGRMYDPLLGRFLSPDPYIQAPTDPQNFNRYSYCLNNPLKYTDPDGEFWHIVIGAAVGGIINLATNWDNCDGFWEYAAAFGVGAGAGALTAATGGASVGWQIGAAALGGAATSATNNLIAQTKKNFTGPIDWGQVGYFGIVGAIAGTASYGASSWAISNLSTPIINGLSINSPVLAQGINGAVGGAAGGFAGGFAGGYLLSGFDVNEGWKAAISGFKTGVAIGGGMGAAGGYVYAKQNNINPWTGKTTQQPRIDTEELIQALGLKESLERINEGVKLPYNRDGYIFENREKILPIQKSTDYYKEYVHPTPGINGPGQQRIVIGENGEIYYTPDHYHFFIRIR